MNPRMAAYRSSMRSTGPGARNPHSAAPPYSYPPNRQQPPQYYGTQGPLPPGMRPMSQMPTHHNGPPPNYPHNSYMQPQQSMPLQPSMSQYGSQSSSLGSSSGFPGSTSPSYSSSPASSYGGGGAAELRPQRSYQHSPIPGNPTPPLTPASAGPPCYNMSHGGDTKPVISSSKSTKKLSFIQKFLKFNLNSKYWFCIFWSWFKIFRRHWVETNVSRSRWNDPRPLSTWAQLGCEQSCLPSQTNCSSNSHLEVKPVNRA